MNARTIGTQVKDIFDESAARLKGLEGKGRKAALDVAAKAIETASHGQEAFAKGQKAVQGLLGDIRPHDLLERYGRMTVPELIEKLKSSELSRDTEAIRSEVLGFLKVPRADQVARLDAAVTKLNKEVAALKGLKAEIKKMSEKAKAPKAEAKAPAAKAASKRTAKTK